MSRNFLIRKIGTHADVVHIIVPDALDSFIAYQLQERMEAFMQEGFSKYIINLEDVRYVSSVGIQVLYGLQEKLLTQQGNIVLTRMPEKIHHLFTKIGVNEMFGMTATVTQALHALDPDARQ